MLKKLFSSLGIVAVLAAIVPSNALSATQADVVLKNFISSATISVSGGDVDAFSPSTGETLAIKANFNTSTYGTELASATGHIRVYQGSMLVKTVKTFSGITSSSYSGSWNGKSIDSEGGLVCGSSGDYCPVGDYTVEYLVEYEHGGETWVDFESEDFSIVEESTISSFELSDLNYNPVPDSGDEDLDISYDVNGSFTSVKAEILNQYDDVVFNESSSSATGTFDWDGRFGNDLVEPGNYVAVLQVKDGSTVIADDEIDFDIFYNNDDMPELRNFDVDDTNFDPEDDDIEISFSLENADAEITLEIRDDEGDVYRTFPDFDEDDYDEGDDLDEIWDGTDNSGDQVPNGDYLVVVVARNDYGVDVEMTTVKVDSDDDSSGGEIKENAHIEDFEIDPDGTFNPAEDEEIEISFEAKKDLDKVTVYAVRGGDRFEIDDERHLDDGDDIEMTWDGTEDNNGDEDEYVDAGTWRIEVVSELDGNKLTAYQKINIEYEKPQIRDFLISKDEIDPDEDESLYIIFRVEEDAEVDIQILEDNDVDDDDFVEDYEVDGDKWYAVEWDGDNYDEDDDVEIRLIAKNRASDKIYDDEDIGVDVEEDDVSSNKANVLRDYIDPVIGNQNDDFEIRYYLDDDAEVTVTIHEGENGNGKAIAELIEDKDQDEGWHTIKWNGRDDDGDRLDEDEVYSYKIVSDKGSKDTEVGAFVIGDVGDIDGSADGGGSHGDDDDDDDDQCDGFKDVDSDYEYCDAIEWAEDQNIFIGYRDGTFRENQPINRAEMLKVIFVALNMRLSTSTNTGFSDVPTNVWYTRYVATARSFGIARGDSGKTTFRPADSVNRAEALKFVFEALDTANGYDIERCSGDPYPDVNQYKWYGDYVCESERYDLFETDRYGNFNPGSKATRGEIAQLLYLLDKEDLL